MSLTFYEKAFADNYEEFITYYPAFYQQVYEMREILRAQGRLMDGVEAKIEQAYLNNFIDCADAETIGNLETFLNLEYNHTKELEMRRRIVKTHFAGGGKMSGSLIKAIIKELTDQDCDVSFDSSKLVIEIPFHDDVDIAVIREVLNNSTIPAHIAVDIYLSESSKGNIRAGIVWQDDEVFNLKEARL